MVKIVIYNSHKLKLLGIFNESQEYKGEMGSGTEKQTNKQTLKTATLKQKHSFPLKYKQLHFSVIVPSVVSITHIN